MFNLWLALATVGGMLAAVAIAWFFCRELMPLSRAIDRIGSLLGVVASWLVLLACVVSAGNATIRYLFSYSSNAWLELQWYMFAGMVLLGSAYTLKVNEHVRVDLLYGWVSERTRTWIDLFGGIFCLMPFCVILAYITWPWFVDAWYSGEISTNAGGLVRWPVKLILPLGFFFVAVQGVSEIIKCIAALTTDYVREHAYEKPLQ